MLGITTCHVLETPAKTWSFVGRVPSALCHEREATRSDIMGGRAYKDEKTGKVLTLKTAVFKTEKEARDFAAAKDVELAN